MIPFLLIGVALGLQVIKDFSRYWYRMVATVLTIIVGLSLFVSVDPVSKALLGKTSESAEPLYDLRGHWAGNDGITYNLQYAAIINKRTRLIKAIQARQQSVLAKNCAELAPDPSTDRQTFAILKLDSLLEGFPCR